MWMTRAGGGVGQREERKKVSQEKRRRGGKGKEDSEGAAGLFMGRPVCGDKPWGWGSKGQVKPKTKANQASETSAGKRAGIGEEAEDKAKERDGKNTALRTARCAR
jgi:hypothetical protein